MKKVLVSLVSVGLIVTGAVGCSGRSAAMSTPRASAQTVIPRDALSNLHHPVATKNVEAQRHFDDGLTLCYAFNHDEAIRSFKKAIAADPNLAMAHWGIAYALGPNYNVDVDEAREKQAYDEIQKAKELSASGPQAEKDYIAALATRFSNADKPDLKKLAHDYAAAMKDLSARYPDDLDAATLYADAMMNLHPWKLWSKDYKPAEGTEEIVLTLESVLRRDPDHIGANHLYIHSVEASRTPQRALEAAARLPGLAPECGHLVHMPSHIYARVGDHESAVTSNEAAVTIDKEYFAKHPEGKGGIYEMMYFPHNIHFCAYAEAYQGNGAAAKKWAAELYSHAQPMVAHMPMLEGFTDVPIQIAVKTRRWDDILSGQITDEKSMPITTAMWHWARAMAFAERGDFESTHAEREMMKAITAKVAPDAMHGMLNKASDVFGIAQNVLDAKVAAKQKKWSEAEQYLRQAVKIEDSLVYMEPPDWLLPTRETLGGVLLQAGDAAGAEKVFREELDNSPRGGPALFGLYKSLEAQGKTYDAGQVRRLFDIAWKNADRKLTVEQL